MHETVPRASLLVGNKSSEQFGLDRNDSKYVPDGLKSLHREEANASAKCWLEVLDEEQASVWAERAVIARPASGELISLRRAAARRFVSRRVNWLLPPAGSNVNTRRKSHHASFLECLNVPGHLACIP